MTEWDPQEGRSDPLTQCVVLHNNARGAAVDGATEADPTNCADLRQTTRAIRALSAASIYTPEWCIPQSPCHRDSRTHARQLSSMLRRTDENQTFSAEQKIQRTQFTSEGIGIAPVLVPGPVGHSGLA